ncbi:MAG: hypothetical protein AB8B47_02135 [Roseobacter sp.]
MSTASQEPNDKPMLNVVQVIAVHGVITTGTIGGLFASGMSFGASFIVGCMGGAVVTVGALLTAALVADRRENNQNVDRNSAGHTSNLSGPPLVQGQFSTIEALWNSDRLLEIEYARERKSGIVGSRKYAPTSAEVIDMWEEDAASDAVEHLSKIGFLKRQERRKNTEKAEYFGQERRVATR